MKQDDPQFKFRLKPELKKRLDQAASESTRTLGAEIVARLEASFEDGPNEFAEWERYKRELLLRSRIEHARVNAGAFAQAFVELYEAVQDGTWAQRKSGIEDVAKMAQRQLDSIKDGDFARLTAEYEAAKTQYESFAARHSPMKQAQNKVLDALRSTSVDTSMTGETGYLTQVSEIVSRRHEPEVVRPTVNKGPARSRNAGKPKVK